MIVERIVPGPSLVDAVAERLRGMVSVGDLQPGDRLPKEVDLRRSLGVSRTVLREALKRLEGVGLVALQRGRQGGIFVGNRGSVLGCASLIRSALSISAKDLSKFAELRGLLERHAARLAAERARPEDIAELETLCDGMIRPDTSYEECLRLDFQFHLKLMELSGNEVMRAVMDVLAEFMLAGMVKVTARPEGRRLRRKLHVQILEAIRRGDPDAAEEAMKAHMKVLDRKLAFINRADRGLAPGRAPAT